MLKYINSTVTHKRHKIFLPCVVVTVLPCVDADVDTSADVAAFVLPTEFNGTVLVLIRPKPNVSRSDCS